MRTRWMAVGLIMAGAACAPGEDAQQTEETAPPPPAATTLAPDTTDAALWSHLQTESYRSWALWPGKGQLYTGGEPHGMLLTTYVNRLAADALNAGLSSMPAGAIIVKENFMPDSTLAAVTVMHKVPGYSPGSGDWFWAKYTPDGGVDASGRVAGCIGCHGGGEAADYLLTARPQ